MKKLVLLFSAVLLASCGTVKNTFHDRAQDFQTESSQSTLNNELEAKTMQAEDAYVIPDADKLAEGEIGVDITPPIY